MATTFHSHGLQFSANCGADFDGGTQYAGFGLTGVDTYAMMDPTCKRRIPGSIALAVRLLHNVCCTTARVLHNRTCVTQRVNQHVAPAVRLTRGVAV